VDLAISEKAKSTLVEDTTSSKSAASSTAEQKPSLSEADKQLEAEYQTGYELYNNRLYTKCISEMDSIINKNSNFYKAYTIKGIAQCFSNNYSEGIKNLDHALLINPNYGYGRYDRALALELYGYYDEAIKEYLQALDIEPYIWSYYGISSIYGRRGDVANTVKYLEMAINEAPKENSSSEDVKASARVEKDFNPVKNSKQFKDLVG
jgi:tetratricopeptide (TPR) repeat protein